MLPGSRVISQPEFRDQTGSFLELIGSQEGPIGYQELVASRAEAPDPSLAGVPEAVKVRTDLLLPLPGRPLRVRLYREVTETPRPLLLWLHGGGFVGGTLEDVDVACTGLARRAHLNVISLEYRLAPEHSFPAALHDTYDTLSWLREHGAALGGDGQILAGGQSSGANLVAATCLRTRDLGAPQVARQVLCYPPLDFSGDSEAHRRFDGVLLTRSGMDWYQQQYLAGQAITPYAAPLTAPSLAGLPPALILGAGLDPLRDDARRYAQRLLDEGVQATYLEYDQTPHAFLNFPGALSAAWQAIQDIADHLTTFYGPGTSSAAISPDHGRRGWPTGPPCWNGTWWPSAPTTGSPTRRCCARATWRGPPCGARWLAARPSCRAGGDASPATWACRSTQRATTWDWSTPSTGSAVIRPASPSSAPTGPSPPTRASA